MLCGEYNPQKFRQTRENAKCFQKEGSSTLGVTPSPLVENPFERGTRMIARTAAVLLIFVSTLWGQTTNATLRGSITDQSGAVLPGVTISVKNQGTGEERTILSDETGNYQIAALPV